MSRKVKELMIKEYTQRFSDLEERGCVVLGYSGLDANAANEVRKILAEKNSEMFVIRNRLMELSLQELGMSSLSRCFEGPSALIMSEDPIQAAKAADSAREEYTMLKVFGGYAEGEVLDKAAVEKLSDIPDREVLLGQTLGLITSPAKRFLNGLTYSMRRFAAGLENLKEKKEKEGGE